MFSQFKEDLPERSFKTARKGGGAGLHEFMKSEFMKSSGGLRFDEQGTSDASKMKLLEAFLRLVSNTKFLSIAQIFPELLY